MSFAGGRLGHHLRVSAHALAVEGRKQQLPLAQIALLVEREQGMVPEHGAEREGVRFTGVEDGRVAGEDALHLGGVGQVHHAAVGREVRRDDVAVAASVGASSRTARPLRMRLGRAA